MIDDKKCHILIVELSVKDYGFSFCGSLFGTICMLCLELSVCLGFQKLRQLPKTITKSAHENEGNWP